MTWTDYGHQTDLYRRWCRFCGMPESAWVDGDRTVCTFKMERLWFQFNQDLDRHGWLVDVRFLKAGERLQAGDPVILKDGKCYKAGN